MRRFPTRRRMTPLELVVVCMATGTFGVMQLCSGADCVLGIFILLALGLFGLIIYGISKSGKVNRPAYAASRGSSGGDLATREMADACRAFYGFLRELDLSPRCREELSETPGLEGIGAYGNNFTIFQRLGFMVYCDLRDVYTRLGHNVKSLRNREGVGYAMLILLLIGRETDLSWFYNDTRKSKLLGIVEAFSRTDVGRITVVGHENELRFALLFGQIYHERDWVNRYAALMYRWASLIAKADGCVSETESDVLKSIMTLHRQENGDADGVSGNVRVSGGGDAAVGNAPPPEEREKCGAMPRRIGPRDATKALDELIGLDPVKREIRKLASFINIQHQRERKGLKATPVSYHCVFTGNPGTGKTTVARIVAEIYRELGVVKKGHLVETDRSGLIGEYVGQTAVKANKVIDSALDGVLFVDEAYALVQGGEKDYGCEAIATLLKRMEDDRNRLVVILAGYTDEMKAFIDSNPGLQSRFNRYIEFPDYNAEELARMFLAKARDGQYTCDKDVRASIVDIMRRAVEAKNKNFGNGRFVRNLFENAIQRQAERLSSQAPLTAEMLSELTLHDLGFSYQ